MNAIVVLNYNDSDNTIRYVNDIKNYSSVDKIVVVDNCSSGNSCDRLQCLCNESKVDLVFNDNNAGYAAGNNVGIRFAIKTYGSDLTTIIISNPDIYFSEESFKDIIEALACGYQMSTGLIFNYDKVHGIKQLASNFGWMTPKMLDMFSNCFLIWYKLRRKISKKSIYLDYGKHNEKYINVSCVPGCFFAINVQALSEIGLFDERTFLFGEETILGWQLETKGFKACVVNGTEILHENSTTIKKNIKSNKTKEKYLLDSNLIYMRSYLKCNRFVCLIYKVAFKIGLIENKIVRYMLG